MNTERLTALGRRLVTGSLNDEELMYDTGSKPSVAILPDATAVKIGGQSLIDRGRDAVFPVLDELVENLVCHKLIIGTGGGARTRHVFSIGIDLGVPAGVLAKLAMADALSTAHMLGTLLALKDVVAIPPEMFGHLPLLFLQPVPGVNDNGVPPYSVQEHPPKTG